LPGTDVITLDISTGALLGTTPVGRAPQALAVDGRTGRVFVVNMGDGTVSVLDARSGAFLRTVTVGANPSAVAVDERSGRLFVALAGATNSDGVFMNAGSVRVLDARSGSILHTVALGPDPTAIAVDETTGRVFVASAGGLVRVPDAWGWVPLWLRRRLPFLPPPGPRTHWVPGSVTVLDATR
jgi:YVTN family beta-propeller protein